MSLKIANNIAAMTAHRWLNTVDASLNKSLERLSSGYRINRAADDAAGLAISDRFRAQIVSLKQASKNTTEAVSLIQVAEGAMNETNSILTRLKELATQAASSNTSSDDRTKINTEAGQLLSEIDRIANSTKYSDTKLIDGTYTGTFQVGYENDVNSQISLTIGSMTTVALGVNAVNLSTQAGAQGALTTVDNAIKTVGTERGTLGAVQNRLGSAAAYISGAIENYTASESVIRDVDMAGEMATFTKNQILLQSATAMLAQANLVPQVILTLIGR